MTDICNAFNKVMQILATAEPIQVFNIDRCKGLKCLARIRLGLSLFADHKFRYNFQD